MQKCKCDEPRCSMIEDASGYVSYFNVLMWRCPKCDIHWVYFNLARMDCWYPWKGSPDDEYIRTISKWFQEGRTRQ
jgi:hypothetical protein